MPKINERDNLCKVRIIECSTLRSLVELYEPWNRWLYDTLHEDRRTCEDCKRDKGDAPPEEPSLRPFNFSLTTHCAEAGRGFALQPITPGHCRMQPHL